MTRQLTSLWLVTLVALLVLAACGAPSGPTNRPGEVLVPGIAIVNDLAMAVAITYELDGAEAPQNAKNLDRGTLDPNEAREFLFDIYDSAEQGRCTHGIIRARAAGGELVAIVPAPRCLNRTVYLSEWRPSTS